MFFIKKTFDMFGTSKGLRLSLNNYSNLFKKELVFDIAFHLPFTYICKLVKLKPLFFLDQI